MKPAAYDSHRFRDAAGVVASAVLDDEWRGGGNLDAIGLVLAGDEVDVAVGSGSWIVHVERDRLGTDHRERCRFRRRSQVQGPVRQDPRPFPGMVNRW